MRHHGLAATTYAIKFCSNIGINAIYINVLEWY